jgi:hypothetical protein
MLQQEFDVVLRNLGYTNRRIEALGEAGVPDLFWERGERRIEIGEIKPPKQRERGQKRMLDYLRIGRNLFVPQGKVVAPLGVPLPTGIPAFPTKSPTPGCQAQTLNVDPPQEGLYIYHCEPTYKDLRCRGCKCEEEKKRKPWEDPLVDPLKERKRTDDKAKDKEKEKEKDKEEEEEDDTASDGDLVPAKVIAIALLVGMALLTAAAIACVFIPFPEPIHKVICGSAALAGAFACLLLYAKIKEDQQRTAVA